MTTYVAILDAEIAPDAPVTTSLMHRLRDNPLAIQEGDPSAPSILSASIAQAGKGADGNFTNATTITGFGWFDFAVMTLTAPKTIPAATVIRINGNVTLSDVLTVSRMSLAAHTSSAQVAKENAALAALGFQRPPDSDFATTTGYGGALGGNGGRLGSGWLKIDLSGLNRPWASRFPYVGGNGGLLGSGSGTDFGEPGGGLVLVVEGDCDFTGGTIDASGNPADDTGAGSNVPGTGSGGSIRVLCTGTINNGTFKAASGAGLNGNYVGGGGLVDLVASAFTGTQTFDVTHSATGATTNATDGVATSTAVSRDVLRTMLQRLI